MSGVETALYRHYDCDGGLLYVGISLNALKRTIEHRRGAGWFDKISRIQIDYFPTREEAMAAEMAAIKKLNPKFNIVGRLEAKASKRRVFVEETAKPHRFYVILQEDTGLIDGFYALDEEDKLNIDFADEICAAWNEWWFPGKSHSIVWSDSEEWQKVKRRNPCGLKLSHPRWERPYIEHCARGIADDSYAKNQDFLDPAAVKSTSPTGGTSELPI